MPQFGDFWALAMRFQASMMDKIKCHDYVNAGGALNYLVSGIKKSDEAP